MSTLATTTVAPRYTRPPGTRTRTRFAPLLRSGADVSARDTDGLCPLQSTLRETTNATLALGVECVTELLGAGAAMTEDIRAEVRAVARHFEAYRSVFNPDGLDEADAALRRLYALAAVAPVPPSWTPPGDGPIVARSTTPDEQFRELWSRLVPPVGRASSAQGEVVRIAGRVLRELVENGGVNWDDDFRSMLDTFTHLVSSGVPLPVGDLERLRVLVSRLDRPDVGSDEVFALGDIAAEWVRLNPDPFDVGPTTYRR